MTNQVKLHVGYIGKTREGKRVGPLTKLQGENDPWPYQFGEINYRKSGQSSVGNSPEHTPHNDIIGPWTDDKPEYETGVWYGWNGGGCPVHPETVVQVRLLDPDEEHGDMEEYAGCWDWDCSDRSAIIAFRIVTPYVEPEPKLECWVLKNDNDITADVDKDYLLYLQRKDGGTIHRMIEADDQ